MLVYTFDVSLVLLLDPQSELSDTYYVTELFFPTVIPAIVISFLFKIHRSTIATITRLMVILAMLVDASYVGWLLIAKPFDYIEGSWNVVILVSLTTLRVILTAISLGFIGHTKIEV